MHTIYLDEQKCIEKLIIDTQENNHPTFIIKPTGKTNLLDGNPILKGFSDIEESDRGFIRSINAINFKKKFDYLKRENRAYVVFQNNSFFNLKNVLEKSLDHNLKLIFLSHSNKIGQIDFF